ncbi:hypothetical protein CAEBREN_00893 [Caenorhabditis brenneri]|uniref:Uncharacterized protein n=1 Tax=Caenorhabditis brenneri TaxID=135651 RepID=G0P0I0_CAEBE|nr:hypothetical protein CAEBREN_00893 [Caenorhabditis brenneri]
MSLSELCRGAFMEEETMTEKERLLGSYVEVLALKIDSDQKTIDSWKAKDAINSHDIGLLRNTVSSLVEKLEQKEVLLEELQKEASDSLKNLPHICRCVDQYTTALQTKDRKIDGLSADLHEANSKLRILDQTQKGEHVDLTQEWHHEIKSVLIKMLNNEIKDLNEEIGSLEQKVKDLEKKLDEEKKRSKDSGTQVQQLQGHLVGRAATQFRNRAISEEKEKLQAALSESLAMFSIVSAELEEEKMKNAALMEKLKEKDEKLKETSKGVGRILRGAVEVGIGMKEEELKSEDAKVPVVEENNNVETFEAEEDTWDWTNADEVSETQSVAPEEEKKPKKDKKAKNQWSTVMKNGKTCLTPGFELFKNEAPNKDKKVKKNGKKSKKAVQVQENSVELIKSVEVEEQIREFCVEDAVPTVNDESDFEDDTAVVTSTWLSNLFWFILMLFLGLIFRVII